MALDLRGERRGGEEPRGDLAGDRPAQRELPVSRRRGADEPVRDRAPGLGGDPRPADRSATRRSAPAASGSSARATPRAASSRRSRRSAPRSRSRPRTERELAGQSPPPTPRTVRFPRYARILQQGGYEPARTRSFPRCAVARSSGLMPRSVVRFWAWTFRSVNPPVRIRTPIAIRIAPPAPIIDRVVALDDGERGRHPRERERRHQERDAEPGGVDRKEERAVGSRARDRRRRQDRPEGRSDARGPGDRERGPATTGPPLPARAISASTCHSRFRRTMKRLATKNTPSAMIRAPAIVSSVSWCSLSVRPEAGGGQAQEDEDGREARDEDQAGNENASPADVDPARRPRRR